MKRIYQYKITFIRKNETSKNHGHVTSFNKTDIIKTLKKHGCKIISIKRIQYVTSL